MSDANTPEQNPLEGLIRPWFLPSLGLTVAVGVAIFWMTGLLTESAVGAIVAVVTPLVLAAMVARPALSPGLGSPARPLLWAGAVLAFLVAAIPALEAVHPGEPTAVAEFSRAGEAQALPPGAGGEVLLLVSTRLGAGEASEVSFRLGGFKDPVDGSLRRTTSFARVGRGGRAKVSHDHNADWFEAKLSEGAKEIRLERVQGLTGAPLRVEIFRDWLPHWAAWILSTIVLAIVALGEAKAGKDSGATIAAGVALGFGLVVSYNVTPAQAVVPALWAILLGAIIGAPAGWAFRRLARMAFRAEAGAKSGQR